jgi:hypothetical protein
MGNPNAFRDFFLGSTENVNEDYEKNPFYQMLFGSGGQYANLQGNQDASMRAMQSFLMNAITSAQAYDPNAFWKDFMAAQPGMQELISGPAGSFKSASEANLADFVKQATSETASELSGMGSLYSGALGEIAGGKIGKEAGKSSTELAQLQASLMSQLWGSALPQFAGGRQFQTQNLVNAYLGGANTELGGAQMYASQLANMLGIGADMATPVFKANRGALDYLAQALGLGLQGVGAFGMLGGNKDTSNPYQNPSSTFGNSLFSMTPGTGGYSSPYVPFLGMGPLA